MNDERATMNMQQYAKETLAVNFETTGLTLNYVGRYRCRDLCAVSSIFYVKCRVTHLVDRFLHDMPDTVSELTRQKISQKLSLPSCFWHRSYRHLNGAFGSSTSVDDAGTPLEHSKV